MDGNDTLKEKDAASYIGFKAQTLNKWRSRKRGPAYLRIGGKIRYLRSDLDTFLSASRVDPAATPKLQPRRKRRGGA